MWLMMKEPPKSEVKFCSPTTDIQSSSAVKPRSLPTPAQLEINSLLLAGLWQRAGWHLRLVMTKVRYFTYNLSPSNRFTYNTRIRPRGRANLYSWRRRVVQKRLKPKLQIILMIKEIWFRTCIAAKLLASLEIQFETCHTLKIVHEQVHQQGPRKSWRT